MKCPHCKKAIRVTANPVRGGGGRLSSPTARRSVSVKQNPRGARPEYECKFGRRSVKFFAKNDKAAQTYANGLLKHKEGRAPSSLRRTGRKEPKK